MLTRYNLPVFLELSQYCRIDWIFSPSSQNPVSGRCPARKRQGLRYIEIPTLKPFGEKFECFSGHSEVHSQRKSRMQSGFSSNFRYFELLDDVAPGELHGIPPVCTRSGFLQEASDRPHPPPHDECGSATSHFLHRLRANRSRIFCGSWILSGQDLLSSQLAG